MRIAHITDIHVLSLEGVSPLDFLSQRLLGGANLLFNRAGEYPVQIAERLVADINAQQVDHLIVSGDLTNLSLQSEFTRARQVLEGLDLGPQQVTVLPGNHDCYTLSEYLAGNFSKTFAPFLQADLRMDGAAFPFVRLRGPVAIVALDSSHPSPPMMATGHLGRSQRRRLEALLQREELADHFKLVAVHHPPRSPYASWHKRLLDGRALIQLLKRTGADLLIHGHLHRELRDQLPGPAGRRLQVVGANSSTWATSDLARRASYNIYQVEPGEGLTVTRRVLNAAGDAFAAAEALPL